MIDMAIVLVLMRILDVMFFVGLAGSSIVVFYSFIEDAIELFAKDDVPIAQGASVVIPAGSGTETSAPHA